MLGHNSTLCLNHGMCLHYRVDNKGAKTAVELNELCKANCVVFDGASIAPLYIYAPNHLPTTEVTPML